FRSLSPTSKEPKTRMSPFQRLPAFAPIMIMLVATPFVAQRVAAAQDQASAAQSGVIRLAQATDPKQDPKKDLKKQEPKGPPKQQGGTPQQGGPATKSIE